MCQKLQNHVWNHWKSKPQSYIPVKAKFCIFTCIFACVMHFGAVLSISVSYQRCLTPYPCSLLELHARYDNYKVTEKPWTTFGNHKPPMIKTKNRKSQRCRKPQNQASKSQTLKNRGKKGPKPQTPMSPSRMYIRYMSKMKWDGANKVLRMFSFFKKS